MMVNELTAAYQERCAFGGSKDRALEETPSGLPLASHRLPGQPRGANPIAPSDCSGTSAIDIAGSYVTR